MAQLQEIKISPSSIDRFASLLGEERVQEAKAAAKAVGKKLEGRVIWNVNSTARGGGVAEMLRSILAYPREEGIDARWVVIEGSPGFFQITKTLHNALHGSSGYGAQLGERERSIYDEVLAANAVELEGVIRPGDIIILHDPQTAGLAPHLAGTGAYIIWRCHIGQDEADEEIDRGWAFLAPYLEHAKSLIFSRQTFIPHWARERSIVIPPSIDPFSAKNQELDDATVRAILVHTGIVEGPMGNGYPAFLREDGSPGRIDRQADIIRLGRAPNWDTPLVVQVSRWDHLKDPIGVMNGFSKLLDSVAAPDAELVLAGPNVTAVTDDPEGASVWEEVIAAWRGLPHSERKRVHLASLPMADVEENAAIVNALQRHAAVVVQKSVREGFGLTVTEAMWKARPIVAAAVGGIQDQITSGVHGLLVKDPTDLDAFSVVLSHLLQNPAEACELGKNARQRVIEEYLPVRHLLQYAKLLGRIET